MNNVIYRYIILGTLIAASSYVNAASILEQQPIENESKFQTVSDTPTDASSEATASQPESVDPAFAEFDSNFLFGVNQGVDLSRFNYTNTLLPGEYQVWTTLNQSQSFEQDVLIKQEKGQPAQYCFRKQDIERWGVDLQKLSETQLALIDSDCIEISKLIPEASFRINDSDMTAQLLIPQASLINANGQAIDPELWDYGINAGFLRYNAYAGYSDSDNSSQDNYSLSITAGANLGRWRLRHSGNYSVDDDHDDKYNSLSTYVQTDVTPMFAQFTAGEYYTPGDIIDSVPFTGVQLSSDDSMLPENERGYAPVIRGSAQTNAQVEVSQEGRTIYTTSVPPGDFIIDDLYSTGYAGDLTVTVTEANGEQKSFIVPFSAVVQMLRPGASRFSVATGKYRNDDSNDEPWFGQGTYRRGITNDVTLYTGGLVSDGYYSGSVGIAYGSPIGAFAFDVTGAYSEDIRLSQDHERDSEFGQSYRITYNKLIQATSTNLAIAAYQYSSDNYLEFGDYAQTKSLTNDDLVSSSEFIREKSRFQLNLSQPIFDAGNLYASGYYSNYWNESDSQTNFQVGYSHSFNWGTFSVSAERVYEDSDTSDNYTARMTFPLTFGQEYMSLSTEYNYDEASDSSAVRTNLTGTLGEYSQFSYGLYANQVFNDDGDPFGYGANAQYNSSYARLSANANFTETTDQYSASMSGTLVGYSGGLILTPDQGETIAIVEAEGATGAKVRGSQGVEIGRFGNAALTGLTNYRYNEVSIDPGNIPNDVELKSNVKRVVPRRGAIVKVKFETTQGQSLFLKLDDPKQVPFGAEVINEAQQTLGFVGQGGVIYVRNNYKELMIQWAALDSVGMKQCRLEFKAPVDSSLVDHQVIPARCL